MENKRQVAAEKWNQGGWTVPAPELTAPELRVTDWSEGVPLQEISNEGLAVPRGLVWSPTYRPLNGHEVFYRREQKEG